MKRLRQQIDERTKKIASDKSTVIKPNAAILSKSLDKTVAKLRNKYIGANTGKPVFQKASLSKL